MRVLIDFMFTILITILIFILQTFILFDYSAEDVLYMIVTGLLGGVVYFFLIYFIFRQLVICAVKLVHHDVLKRITIVVLAIIYICMIIGSVWWLDQGVFLSFNDFARNLMILIVFTLVSVIRVAYLFIRSDKSFRMKGKRG